MPHASVFPIHKTRWLFPIVPNCAQLQEDLLKWYIQQLSAPFSGVTCTFLLPVWMSVLAVSIWRGDVCQVLSIPGPSSGGICSWWCFFTSHFKIILLGWLFLCSLMHLSCSSMVCISTLHPNLLSVVFFMYVGYMFFALFVIPRAGYT